MPREMPAMRSKKRDEEAVAHGKRAAKKFSSGSFTASQTGAADLAEKRNYMEASMYKSSRKQMKKGLVRGDY